MEPTSATTSLPTPSYLTVPAPSLSGDSSASGAQGGNGVQIGALASQEVHIAKVQNTMSVLEDQNMTHDPRYASLSELKNRLQNRIPFPGPMPTIQVQKAPTDPAVHVLLKAQLDAFKMLKTQQVLPASLLEEATRVLPQMKRKPEAMPAPYEIPHEVQGQKLPYDLLRLQNVMMQRTMKNSHQLPKSVDPNVIAKEREQRISTRILARIKELSELPADLPEHLRVKAMIELRALRLINVQAAVRREVLHAIRLNSTVEQGLNAHAYRRVKKHTLREARVTERLERQQKLEQERRRRMRHNDFLQSTVQTMKEFKEFHRNNLTKMAKMRKAVQTYHANSEKERKKDEQKNEKLRMMKLMQEDEEGYRQLLDEKKDKRLVYLLQQTDEYVESLTGLVRQHQQTEKRRKKKERREAIAAAALQGVDDDLHITIRNCATGEVLKPEETPKPDELDAWLESHPGFELVSRDANSDSEDDDKIEEPVVVEEVKEDEFEGLDEEERRKQILEKARNEDDEYDAKNRRQMESYYATAHKIKEKVVKQHSTMGGGDPTLQLKPYQLKGLEWMVSLYNNNLNGILADEMGLGKTIQTVALITYLMEVKKINGPYLVIVPLSTISNWNLEFDKWSPCVTKIVYKGNRDVRKRMDAAIKKGSFNVLLTTYDYVLKEKSLLGKIRWKYMIIDEGHRMKNHNCKLTLTLNAYFSAQHRLLLTGTPLQNKLPELWALLNFLLPSIFSSCGTFEQWFNAPFATTGEKVELNQEETMLIIRRLHKVLRPFLLRRLKKEVESQLPEKTEQVIKCDMSPLQRMLYAHMKNGYLLDGNRKEGRAALMNTVVHLRKLCNHPFLFDTVEDECRNFWNRDITGLDLCRVAGKFELLDRILPKLKATNHRILIFCQMTQLMTIMEDYFTYRGWLYLRLDGSTKPDERGELLKLYNAPNSDIFIFMLSTRAGGLGLNLQTADTVIIFDSDWNPHQDMQAQDRAHRIGQVREVRVFRLITINSVEEKILAAARYKLNVDEKVIQAGKFDQRSTGAERRQMLEAIIRREEDEEEDEIPDDEAINNIIARGDDEYEYFQKMDQERYEAQRNQPAPLIEDHEIPANIVQSSHDFAEIEKNIKNNTTPVEDLSGRRARKKVDYSQDLMSEKEWLRSIDEDPPSGDDEDDEASNSSSRKRRRTGGGAGGSDTPKQRGRKRKERHVEEDDEEDDEASRSGASKKRRRGPASEDVSAGLSNLLETLISYKDSNKRVVSAEFLQLPSRKELQDYYEVVERPIDFNKIRKNVRNGKYSTVDALGDDVQLLCENAMKYNVEDSEIYQDASLLLAVWRQLKSSFIQSSNSGTQSLSVDSPAPPGPSSSEATTAAAVVKEEDSNTAAAAGDA